MTMPVGLDAARLRRERVQAVTREVTRAEIKTLAHDQLTRDGVQGVNLRGIGRTMGLTASALYNYFESRDELITALVADGYQAVGDAMESAALRAAAEGFRGRFLAVAHAMRTWAIDHPAQFGLIFGSPLPGYTAPPQVTRPLALRAQELLVAPLAAAHHAGVLRTPDLSGNDVYRQQLMALVSHRGFEVPAEVLAAFLHTWSLLHGVVSLSVFGHLGPGLPDATAMFATEAEALADRLGLPS